MELVPVSTVGDAFLANVVKGVLEQAGIEAVIGDAGLANVYPTPTVNPYHILVREEDADRARDVLAQYDAVPDDGDDEDHDLHPAAGLQVIKERFEGLGLSALAARGRVGRKGGRG